MERSDYERLDTRQLPNAGHQASVVRFGRFALAIVSLPLFSFLFCVIWSLLYFFERSTSTHCAVDNYLPSISAAIGNYQPQRFIWQTSILLQFLPRLLIAKYYLNYYLDSVRKMNHCMIYTVFALNVIENFALVGLSLWTSSDNYGMLYEIYHHQQFVMQSIIQFFSCRCSPKFIDCLID